MTRSKIVILDFGSQYSHLIAKRFRLLGYYAEIALPCVHLDAFNHAKGIVFSGGPASIYDPNMVPEFNQDILNLDIPILGLCYGHYVVNVGYGGKVGKAPVGEFGYTLLTINQQIQSPIFDQIQQNQQQVWMSHQDCVLVPGQGFEIIAQTPDCQYAALQNLQKKRFTLQFHCEVNDTPCGNQIFENFARFCKMDKNWNQSVILDHIIADIQNQILEADKKVLLFLSGGVDSTVTFALLNKALGQNRVLGLHIDNGFMRKNESSQIQQLYHKHGFHNFILHDATESFLKAIHGVTDPQQKRIIIGEHFLSLKDEIIKNHEIFKACENDHVSWILAQGTLYPDIIESGGTLNSQTIKTHHNRVSSIQDLIQKGQIIEPIRDLYKDEVRCIGKIIGLSDELIMRHPFPGPGLSINVICNGKDAQSWAEEKDFQEYLLAVKELDEIDLEKYAHTGFSIHKSVLPIRTVGVQGDFRTYKFPAIITLSSNVSDTSCGSHGAHGFYHYYKREEIEEISSLITNSTKYINRVCMQVFQNKQTIKSEGDMKLQLGYCNKYRLDQLREIDDIVLKSIKKYDWYDKIFQHLTISIPYSTLEERSSFVLRPVCSEDVMTARFAYFPKELIDSIIEEVSKLDYVDALYYDVTNKPPATFGWE